MILNPETLEQWRAEYPIDKVTSMVRKLDLTEPIAEQVIRFYDYICNDWSEFEGDEEMIFEVRQTNQIEEAYNAFFTAYKQSLSEGHSHVWSFVYASNAYYDSSAEFDAKREAYLSEGIDVRFEALCECKAQGKSQAYTKKFAEGITEEPYNLEGVIESAKKFEAGYLKCIASGYSEIYADQYGRQIYGMTEDFAHDFAYSYEIFINAGMTELEAWSYANDLALRLDGGTWIFAILKMEAEKLAKESNIQASIFEHILSNEYSKVMGFPNPDSADFEEKSKQQATDIMSGEYSLDLIKDNALASYHSLKKNLPR